jgi:hypothetical protein
MLKMLDVCCDKKLTEKKKFNEGMGVGGWTSMTELEWWGDF